MQYETIPLVKECTSVESCNIFLAKTAKGKYNFRFVVKPLTRGYLVSCSWTVESAR